MNKNFRKHTDKFSEKKPIKLFVKCRNFIIDKYFIMASKTVTIVLNNHEQKTLENIPKLFDKVNKNTLSIYIHLYSKPAVY